MRVKCLPHLDVCGLPKMLRLYLFVGILFVAFAEANIDCSNTCLLSENQSLISLAWLLKASSSTSEYFNNKSSGVIWIFRNLLSRQCIDNVELEKKFLLLNNHINLYVINSPRACLHRIQGLIGLNISTKFRISSLLGVDLMYFEDFGYGNAFFQLASIFSSGISFPLDLQRIVIEFTLSSESLATHYPNITIGWAIWAATQLLKSSNFFPSTVSRLSGGSPLYPCTPPLQYAGDHWMTAYNLPLIRFNL